jgi:SAM-dependent methyltransferase
VGGRFSFEVVDASDYDELRPDYAWDAIDMVLTRGALGARSVVVDLAAGTGQLSRRFVSRGVPVVAVEPARNMRAVLESRLPAVRALDGTAEHVPLGDSTVDVVVVGNAFHHFDRGLAFAEIGRVLRSGGLLALFWAWPLEEEQRAISGMGAIYEVVEAARTSNAIAAAYRSWEEPPATADGFGPFERSEFRVTHVIASARLADLYATSSDVASLPPAGRDDLLARIRGLTRGLPEILELPARTVVDLCVRDGRSLESSGASRKSG